MNTIVMLRGQARNESARAKHWLTALLALLLGVNGGTTLGHAQPAEGDVAGAQVLTRGPVHEAFAGIVTFNPEPGLVVTKAPPEAIEEAPPDERPEGDNITWIPGYWAWDDERGDFLWVSGAWRALPPGRAWVAGYWTRTTQGFQWISGYWADSKARETTYLPPPPTTLESGPNIAAPSPDYGWAPGCWIWYQGRYAWRPGYWTPGRAEWDWIPAHYVYTPRGYILAGGFWDYPVHRRGLLFAPVYFDASLYSRRGYRYSPRIVIDMGVFSDHLFLRPRYQHYYFGDYYALSYQQSGFYASFSFQTSRYGYDPIFAHQRWEHRNDRGWERRIESSYQYRRDHENARPPRTWAAQRNFNPGNDGPRPSRGPVAVPINQLASRKDHPMKLQPVRVEERQQLSRQGQAVQKSRAERQNVESRPATPTGRPPGEVARPATVNLPRSPIAAKPARQLDRSQAPPSAPRAPKPEPRFQPAPESAGRPVTPQRGESPGRPDTGKRPGQGRDDEPRRER